MRQYKKKKQNVNLNRFKHYPTYICDKAQLQASSGGRATDITRGAPSCKILVAHSENENISRWFRLIFWLISMYENQPKPPKLSIYDQIEVDKKSIWSDKFILCGMVKFGKQYFSSLFFYFPIKYIISDYDRLISPIFL